MIGLRRFAFLLVLVAFWVGGSGLSNPPAFAAGPAPGAIGSAAAYGYDGPSSPATAPANSGDGAIAARPSPWASFEAVGVAAGCCVATKEGLGEAASKIPAEWGAGGPARAGGGWRWSDPANPSGNGVRVDPWDPNGSLPEGQVPHVHVRSNGEVLGADGQPVPSGRAGDPAAHIPYSTWRNWGSWNSP